MKKLLAATFVALLMVGCDGTDRVGRELREGFSRKHNKGSAEKRRQAVLAELNWAKRSNPTELKLSSIGSIADLTPLKGLTNLEVLAIKVSVSRAKKNRYTDLTPLAELENLEDLYIDCNYPGFNSLNPLARLTKLKRLTLYQKYGTSSATRDPLKGLTNLRYLNLYENQNPDITALAGLTNLTELSLGRNKITDITPLTGLIQLKTLNLWENHVTDLTPLTGLTKLEKLNLYGNPIPKDQFDMLIKALPDCEIKGLSYDYYSNGQKKSEFYYKDSQLERGATKWYSNGQKMVEGNFKNGKLWTAVAWKPNGEKCPVTNVVRGNGVWVEYNDDGTEKERLYYKDGEEAKANQSPAAPPDAKPAQVGKIDAQEKEAEVEANPSSAEPPDAKIDQVSKIDLDDPKTRKKIVAKAPKVVHPSKLKWRKGLAYFKGGPFTGIIVKKYPNGQKSVESTWKDGKKVGLDTQWYKSGQKKSERIWKDGKEIPGKPWARVISTKEWDADGNPL